MRAPFRPPHDGPPYDGIDPAQLILRDRLAADRTVLANERTLLSCVRTALGLLGGGVALVHFGAHPWVRWTGGALILLAPVLLAIGVWRFKAVRNRLRGFYGLAMLTFALSFGRPADAAAQGAPASIAPPSVRVLVEVDHGTRPAGLGGDGFALRTARLRLGGETGRVRYALQGDLAQAPVLLDAQLTVPLGGGVGVEAGLFKSPFSRELLLFRADLPLAERARGVRALAPARQVGIALRLDHGLTTLRAGLFNGNGGRTLVNDGAGYLGVARAETALRLRNGSALRLGANVAYSRDEAAFLPGLFDAFAGERLLAGADAELTSGSGYVLMEGIAGRLDVRREGPESAQAAVLPWGLSLTGGYGFAGRHRLDARLDLFDPGRPGRETDPVLVAGYSVVLTPTLHGRTQYSAPSGNLGAGAFLARLGFLIR